MRLSLAQLGLIQGREATPAYLRYVNAAGLAVAGIVVTAVSRELFSGGALYIPSIGAVALSAWYGGFRTGLVTMLVGLLGINVFVAEPAFPFLSSRIALVTAVFYVLVSLLISWMEENRRRSETALREARDELQIVLNGVSDGITAQTEDGRPVFANPAAASLLGFPSVPSLLATTDAQRRQHYTVLDEQEQVVPPSKMPRITVFESGQIVTRTFKIRLLGTGEERWVTQRSAPVFDARHNVKLVVNVLQDITERKQAELILQRLNEMTEIQRARLDRLIGNVPGIVYDSVLVEGGQQMTFVSPYAKTMLGYELERWQEPRFWTSIIHPDDREQVERESAEQLESGDSGEFEFRAVRADGGVIPCATFYTIIRSSNGTPIGLAGVIVDISERKEAEEVLRQFADQLRRSNEELEQFAYVASHDLQEPLRMVTSYLQLIEQRYGHKLDSEGGEFIGFAVDGATRMKALITDLLAYSRVQRAKIVFGPVQMEKVVEQVISNLRLAIEDTRATVTYDPLPEITANEPQMIQLLQNLMENALKFRRDDPPAVHISAQSENGDWIFSVRDNGIGISRDYLDRIFVIFQRLHARERYPGTGIGLAVCKKIIDRHGGRIWVDSTPGEGSTFYFSLPVTARKVFNGGR